MQQRLIHWFNGLSSREQWLTLAGAGMTLALVLYQMLWQPLGQSAQAIRDANRDTAQTLQWIAQNRSALQRLSGSVQAEPSDAAQRSLTEIVNQTTAEHQVTMSRFQPGSNNLSQVWLDNVPFDRALRWIDALEHQHGIAVVGVTIKLQDSPGQVNVRARLRR